MLPTTRLAQLAVILILVASIPSGAQAQVQKTTQNGVDLVVLVDISSSTAFYDERTEKLKGTDVDRIRWDATNLICNLLGPNDRILVQRFNNACPVSSTTNAETLKYIKYWADPKQPDSELLTDFSGNFVKLSTHRADIQKKLDAWNAPYKEKSSQFADFGATRIVDALLSVKEIKESRQTSRPMHVVLMTDGLCNQFQIARLRAERSKLLDLGTAESDSAIKEIDSALATIRGYTPGAEEFESPSHLFEALKPVMDSGVPIHSIAFGLESEPVDAPTAREFLQQLALQTTGQFFEVANSKDLIPASIKLIRQIKGYWVDDTIPILSPSGKDQTTQVESLIVNGITDLGILSYEEDPQSVSPKLQIRPPEIDVKFNWDTGAYNPPSKPVTRSGKRQSLYHYHYFGQSLDTKGILSVSPFAEYKKPVTLRMEMRSSSRTQHMVLLKGTGDLNFRITSPSPRGRLYRHQRLLVAVEMDKSAAFLPNQFSAWARIVPSNQKGSSIRASNVQERNKFKESAIQLGLNDGEFSTVSRQRFVAELLLTNEKHFPITDRPTDIYELAILIEGTTKAGETKHALSGHSLDLITRSFEVINELPFKPVRDITLSNASATASLTIETAIDVKDPIELQVEFVQPQIIKANATSPASIPPAALRVLPQSVASGSLVLQQGRGIISLNMDSKELDPKLSYLPGKLRLTSSSGLMRPKEGLESKIEIRLDIATTRLTPELSDLKSSEMLTKSGPHQIVLFPPNQKGFDESRQIDLELVLTRRPNQTKAIEESPGEFTNDELWIEPHGMDKKLQKIKTSLNQQFLIKFHPKGQHLPGVYQYNLKATAGWMAPITTAIRLSVSASEIVIDADVTEFDIARGESQNISVLGYLRGLKDAKYPAYFDAVQPDAAVVFTDQIGGKQTFRITNYPAKETPIILSTEKTNARRIDFVVSVPASTPYGIYSTDLKMVGDDVGPAKFTIKVIVNGLEIDILTSESEASKKVWRKGFSEDFIQQANKDASQTLRIRSGIESLPVKKSQVTVNLSDFHEANSEHIQLKPGYESQEAGASLQMKLNFPKVVSHEDLTRPYRLIVTVAPSDVGLKVREARFEFRVYFTKPSGLIKDVDSRLTTHPKR